MRQRLFDPGPRRERPSPLEEGADLSGTHPPMQQPLIDIEGLWCSGCPLSSLCVSQRSKHACPEHAPDEASLPFHPVFEYGARELAAVGGPHLTDISGRTVPIPELEPYVAQLRFRSETAGELPVRRTYGIRLDQILRRRVHTADDVRAVCGVPRGAALILFCFAHDEVLEALWDDVARVRAVAAGGWDLATAPSYSLWYRRPRPMHFHAIRRSFDAYAALLELEAPVIPRIAFVDMRDVERQAEWCDANRPVGLVSLDIMTLRDTQEWLEHAELLAAFDQLTHARLRYVVNGVRHPRRILWLAELLAKRLVVSDATVAIPPVSATEPSMPVDLLPATEWERRICAQERVVQWAHDVARRRKFTSDAVSAAA